MIFQNHIICSFQSRYYINRISVFSDKHFFKFSFYDVITKINFMNILRILAPKTKRINNIGLLRKLWYCPTALFAQTSREIELKMRQQRNKNLNNQFKALQSHFGLKRPQTISANYPKPSTFQFSIQSLRKNSHMYPEYLQSELNKQKSQYYEVIQGLFDSLGNADNKQSIQFILFLIEWKLYHRSQEYQTIIKRKIYQMKLDLDQLFLLLKSIYKIEIKEVKQFIMVNIQNKILERILDINPYEYDGLFKILNFMRVHDLSPNVKAQLIDKQLKEQMKENQTVEEKLKQYGQQSFYKVVEKVLLRNLDQIPLPNLAQMIVHYANNIKQSYDDKIEILSKVQSKVIDNLSFFNHDELIAIIYSYLKTSTHSDRLLKQFIKRIELLYFQISWQNKRKILSLSSSLPHDKCLFIVGLSIHEILKGKKIIQHDGKIEGDPNSKEVQYQLLPSIYVAAYETNLITSELVSKLQPRILQNIFNYPSEDVALITWIFTITPSSVSPVKDNRQLLFTKVQSIIVGGFNTATFTLKDISMLVWSFCNLSGKSGKIFKPNAQLWKNIEYYIQQRISLKKQERMLNGCCQILWAYLNNKSLSIKTINLITNIIIQKESSGTLQQQLFNFQLIMITSFYYSIRSSLPKSLSSYFQNLTIKYFKILLPEMNYLEIIKILKNVLTDHQLKAKPEILQSQIWDKIINQFWMDIEKIEYQYIMAVVGYTLISPQGKASKPKAIQIVAKLMTRKKKLEQLMPKSQRPS